MNGKPKRVVSGAASAWNRVAYRAGELSALAGCPEASNPHPALDAGCESWRDGWLAATAADRRR